MPIAYPGQVFPEWGEEVSVCSNRELPALTLPQNGHKNKQSQNNLPTTPTIFLLLFCYRNKKNKILNIKMQKGSILKEMSTFLQMKHLFFSAPRRIPGAQVLK